MWVWDVVQYDNIPTLNDMTWNPVDYNLYRFGHVVWRVLRSLDIPIMPTSHSGIFALLRITVTIISFDIIKECNVFVYKLWFY